MKAQPPVPALRFGSARKLTRAVAIGMTSEPNSARHWNPLG